MKKYIYILSIIVLGLLPSCYPGGYVEEDRMVGDLKTLDVTYPEYYDYGEIYVKLNGDAGQINEDYLFFQLSRFKEFPSSETVYYPYDPKSSDGFMTRFNGTYYYRLCAALDGDTICAPNFDTFTVDNTVVMNMPEKVTEDSAILSCITNISSPKWVGCYYEFWVSVDSDFANYTKYRSTLLNTTDNDYVYSATVEKLKPGVTYYAKAVKDTWLGPLESDIISFTTQGVLRMGEVTYTGWDGKTYPMIEGYDHFIANYFQRGDLRDRNLEVYYSEDGWKLSKDINPSGDGILFGFYSYMSQDNNNEIQIQTYKYDNPMLMWGMSNELNGEFNINFQNMLSRVVLHISLTDDYPEDKPSIQNFTISSSKLPTIAKFQVNDGGFIYDGNSFTEPFGYWKEIQLVKGETIDVVVYSLPCDSDKAVATFNFLNKKSQVDMEIGWKSGNTYEYSLVFANDGLSISDVLVNEWQPTEGGSITIKP